MATHSSILAWKIPWTEEPSSLQSMGLQRVRHDWVAFTFPICINWYPYIFDIYRNKIYLYINVYNIYRLVVTYKRVIYVYINLYIYIYIYKFDYSQEGGSVGGKCDQVQKPSLWLSGLNWHSCKVKNWTWSSSQITIAFVPPSQFFVTSAFRVLTKKVSSTAHRNVSPKNTHLPSAFVCNYTSKSERESHSVVSNPLQPMDYTVYGILQARILE